MMHDDPPFIALPSPSWPAQGWWLTAFSAGLGTAVVFVPQASGLSFARRIAIVFCAAAVPAALVALHYSTRLLIAVAQRAMAFRTLHDHIAEMREELGKTRDALNWFIRERQNARALKIDHCYYYDSTVIVMLRRKPGFKVEQGERLVVFDREASRVLGLIEIIDTTDNKLYRAKAIKDVDPLWLGYLKQNGNVRTEPPPDAVAMHFIDFGGGDAESATCEPA